MRNIIKPAFALFFICLVVTGALAYTYTITKDTIEERSRIDAENARKEVMPGADAFEPIEDLDALIAQKPELEPVKEAYTALKDGSQEGFVYLVSVKGYGGSLKMMVGIGNDNSITGVKIVEMKETPGLGSKAVEEPFHSQLFGFTPQKPLQVVKGTKSGPEDIEAITGATITSKAVVKGIQAAVDMTAELVQKEGK